MGNSNYDVLIIGSGAAGSFAAIQAASLGAKVALAAKTSLLSGSTRWAQGGVAFPASSDDVASHLADTITAGRGLVNQGVSSTILGDALNIMESLLEMGMKFDADPALEGGHSQARVRHVNGDESGLHLLRFLHSQLSKSISVFENHFASQLLLNNDGVYGAELWKDGDPSRRVHVGAKTTIIATGGVGQLYSVTTNPKECTGDGIALAYRSGAIVRDMELIQFHPTVLPNGALISEACRGEGAKLINAKGEHFMDSYDPAADLAPRDIVARSIHSEERRTGQVFLDLSQIPDLRRKFPTVFSSISSLGIDPSKSPVPVHPAAHYLMGGIATDENGSTTIGNLYAAGEVASTGFHGANRLASNSLLESLVMGARTANEACAATNFSNNFLTEALVKASSTPGIPPDSEWQIQKIMTEVASVVRDEESLQKGLADLSKIPIAEAKSSIEVQNANLRLVALLVLNGALKRRESRGSHFRSDFPETQENAVHVNQQLSSDGAISD